MEIRHLTYFVTLAEHLNFTKAAAQLNITQPPLSRAIKSLEDSLGNTLFTRSKRNVVLTEFGEYFYPIAKQQLNEFSALKKHADSFEDGSVSLRIGFVIASYERLVDPLHRYLQRQVEDVHIELFEYSNVQDFTKRLKLGELDIAFAYAPVNERGIESKNLVSETISAVIRDDDPLVDEDIVTLDKLKGHRIMFHPRETAPELVDHFNLLCNQHGFKPEIDRWLTTQHARLLHVSLFGGVAFGTHNLQKLSPPNLVFKDITDRGGHLNKINIALLWNSNAKKRIIRTIAENIEQMINLKN